MPFIYRRYGDFVDITEIEKESNPIRLYRPREPRTLYGARRRTNIARTRTICVWRVSAALEAFGCPLLVTLTFAGDASDAAFANDSLRRFQVRLRAKFPNAQSIFVPELSPRGRIHFHGLLFNVPMSLGDTRDGRRLVCIGEERKTRTLAKLWGEGFVDARKTNGSRNLAFYLVKYITKGGAQVMFNAMRMLRISQGFPKDDIVRGEPAEYIALKKYADKTPIRVWEGENDFLGKITKKIYHNPRR